MSALIKNLQFLHLVITQAERAVFASAVSGKRIYNFIFDWETDTVKIQKAGKFEILSEEYAQAAWDKIRQYYGRIPVYSTDTLPLS